jgi:hypothetical protein
MHDLRREAEELGPTISWAKKEYDDKRLSDFDFVGLYILLYLGSRRPGAWSSGRLPSPVATAGASSIPIANVPGLLEKLGGFDYLSKRIGKDIIRGMGNSSACQKLAESEAVSEAEAELKSKSRRGEASEISNLTVVQVFNHLKLSGIKKNGGDFVNKCIVLWACGRCPLQLLFYIPTPLVVLRQQARGQRVVSLFTTEEELSRTHVSNLTYMSGDLKHSRCPFEFTLHDLTHMEKFGLDSETYLEQVGFFQCMSKLKPMKAFFVERCAFDDTFLAELEYVISDMNCFSTHLLQYLFAKMVLAAERLAAASSMAVGAVTAYQAETATESTPAAGSAASASASAAAAACVKTESTRELLEQRWRWLLQAFGMLASDSECGYESCAFSNYSNYRCVEDHAETSSADSISKGVTSASTATKMGMPVTLSDEEATATATATARAAYEASMAMIDTAYRERGPMNAAQGEAVRRFFRMAAER